MPEYNIAFARLDQLIPFFHTSITILFIGLQAGFWLMATYFMKSNLKDGLKYSILMRMLRRFGFCILTLLALIALTSITIGDSGGLIKSANPMAKAILITKWALEIFLAVNMGYMFYQYKKAYVAFKMRDILQINESLVVIISYFIPLNLVISFIAIYLGIAYKEF
ncbi:MAG: 3-isopropylmalate dehydratase [Campylobacter sp.]|nr:3-isopropylmalate dehydratase [Campylobacter sp.]